MKADLHFHPSFFSGNKFHISEPFGMPSLDKIVDKAAERDISLLTITSCSNAVYRDKRWDDYTKKFGKSQSLIYGKTRKHDEITICHGQEFKTDKHDVNVIFADRIIPVKESSKVPDKVDFNYLLDSARDYGQNVIIAIPAKSFGLTKQDRGDDLTEEELRELYEKRKFDVLEVYDAMAPWFITEQSAKIASNLMIPRFGISDGHRLEDLGKNYIEIFGVKYISDIAQKIKSGKYLIHEDSLSLISKGLYTIRLASSIAGEKIKRII
jgi:hypothetical protein